ncbi:hypothetical protein PC111_g22695 [Phytophthora cactorum]|nr:hypothetical protein PC111_g22695 [Phytophthora cactorum]
MWDEAVEIRGQSKTHRAQAFITTSKTCSGLLALGANQLKHWLWLAFLYGFKSTRSLALGSFSRGQNAW